MLHIWLLVVLTVEWCILCAIINNQRLITDSKVFQQFMLFSTDGVDPMPKQSGLMNSDAYMMQSVSPLLLAIWFVFTFTLWLRYCWLLIGRWLYFKWQMHRKQQKIAADQKRKLADLKQKGNKEADDQLDKGVVEIQSTDEKYLKLQQSSLSLSTSWQRPSLFMQSIFFLSIVLRLILGCLVLFIYYQNQGDLRQLSMQLSYQTSNHVGESVTLLVTHAIYVLNLMNDAFILIIVNLIIVGVVQLWGCLTRVGYTLGVNQHLKND
ncbi:hypothetical protein MIR68_011982 [Amoeboaphelidium protococcarum]|nr:hypothetical protein MIR68_011982 [Amoeboaphelidium protococcarum]